MRISKALKVSIGSNAAAILWPFLLYLAGFFDPPPLEEDGYVCGLYLLYPILLSIIGWAILSLIGSVAGAWWFRSLPKPRETKAKVGLFLCLLPFAALIAYFTALLLIE